MRVLVRRKIANYHDACPLSIIRLFGVINVLASLISKSAVFLDLFVSANQPNMFSRSHFFFNPGTSSKFRRTMGVSICPDDMQLTRMPRSHLFG